MSTNIFDRLPQIFHKDKPTDTEKYIQILGRENNQRVYKYVLAKYVNEPENLYKYKLYLPSGNGNGIFGRSSHYTCIKWSYPDNEERLNHIFVKQVFGCAPTEIIYRICLNYILGFNDEISIQKHNIKLCDTLKYAKAGTLKEKLEELFPELREDN